MTVNKILFVHGRPAGHPLHAKYGKSITDDFSFEDPWFRWHDKDYPSLVRYFAWILNSFAFIPLRDTVVVTEGFRITLVLSKLLSFGHIKLIMLVADESPYFLYTKYYSRVSHFFNTWGYNKYDYYLCIGKMEEYLVRQVIRPSQRPKVYKSINGISQKRLLDLDSVQYNPDSERIVFVGSGPAPWRMWYKGIDLMVSTFSELAKVEKKVSLEIAGDWNSELIDHLISSEARNRIVFKGYERNVKDFLNGSLLYLHLGRGDAWPISIMEAMAAGIVPLVSEWTGAKECVEQVSEKLVVKLESKEIVERILWFLRLDSQEKLRLSQRCREVASQYPEERAINQFRKTFQDIQMDFQ